MKSQRHAGTRMKLSGLVALIMSLIVAVPVTAGAAEPRPIDAACPPQRVPDYGFNDIDGNAFEEEINCIAWWEIASGRSATTYGPSVVINRAQMATFLANLVTATDGELPSNPPDAFRDDNGSTHEQRINALAAADVVQGTGAETYNPSAAVTRAQMATFLVRTYQYRTGEELPASRDYFRDDDGSFHEASINKVAEAGITAGDASGNYRPNVGVRRDQMAAFVARTLDLLVDTGHGSPPPPPAAVLGFDLESVSADNNAGCWGSCDGFYTGTASISGTQHERVLHEDTYDWPSETHVVGEEYDLGRAYSEFTATVGQGDKSTDTTDRLRFIVYGDGEELGRQEVGFGMAEELHFNVTDVLRLRIEVANLSTDQGSGEGFEAAVAVWGTPTVR